MRDVMFWVWLVVLTTMTIFFLLRPERPKDDTDPPVGRSGMTLFTDAKTGCQYLGSVWGPSIARLDTQGKPMCGGK